MVATMTCRVLAISLPKELHAEIDRAVRDYSAATDTTTSRSGYVRLAIEDRIRRDAMRLNGYKSINRAVDAEEGLSDAR